VSVVYDAGVLIAADRNARTVWAQHRTRLELGVIPVTTAPVVAQASRSTRQTQLHRFLRGCSIVPFAADHAHPVGALLRAAGLADVVDGHLVIVAASLGATVLTTDPHDLSRLSTQLQAPVSIATI
jgi:predicted nucleic acid-binding protein